MTRTLTNNIVSRVLLAVGLSIALESPTLAVRFTISNTPISLEIPNRLTTRVKKDDTLYSGATFIDAIDSVNDVYLFAMSVPIKKDEKISWTKNLKNSSASTVVNFVREFKVVNSNFVTLGKVKWYRQEVIGYTAMNQLKTYNYILNGVYGNYRLFIFISSGMTDLDYNKKMIVDIQHSISTFEK